MLNLERVRRNAMLWWEAGAAVARMARVARDENRQGFSVPATTKENGSFPHHISRVIDALFVGMCRAVEKMR